MVTNQLPLIVYLNSSYYFHFAMENAEFYRKVNKGNMQSGSFMDCEPILASLHIHAILPLQILWVELMN